MLCNYLSVIKYSPSINPSPPPQLKIDFNFSLALNYWNYLKFNNWFVNALISQSLLPIDFYQINKLSQEML